jgi:hypothetical protein
MSRYSHPCPACKVSFFSSEIREKEHGWFRCPACGEWLEYDSKHSLFIWMVSGVLALVFSWGFGYRGLTLLVVAMIATLLLCAVGVFLSEIFVPSRYKLVASKSSPEVHEHHTALHLADRTADAKKKAP